MLYLAANGTVYSGDRQLRADGSFDPELPDRPSPTAQWDGSAWVLPPPAANYSGFYEGLLREGLALFLRVRTLADSNLPVSNVYTDLMGAIGFGKLEGFQSSIANLVLVMDAVGQPFTNEERAQMRTLLDKHGFAAVILPDD